jgi:hypothetical protein
MISNGRYNEEKGETYFWYRLISRRATVPGLYLWGFLTPPVAVDFVPAVFRDALAATVCQLEVQGESVSHQGGEG